jgi:hypothetical protein
MIKVSSKMGAKKKAGNFLPFFVWNINFLVCENEVFAFYGRG